MWSKEQRLARQKPERRILSSRPFLPLALGSFGLLLATSSLFPQPADEFNRQLTSLVKDGRFVEAENVARAALQRHPRDPALNLTAAELALRVGDVRRCAELIQEAVGRGIVDPGLLAVSAQLLLRLGLPDRAIPLLREVVELERGQPRHHHQLALALFGSGLEREAETEAARAVELAPSDPGVRKLHALILDRLGRTEEALEELRSARAAAPLDTGLLLRLADEERQGKRTTRALEYLEMAAAIDPENPLYQRELAMVFQELGMTDEARHASSRADLLEEAFHALETAIELAISDRPKRAAEVLEKVVGEQPSFVTGAAFLLELYRKIGAQSEATALADRLLVLDPGQRSVREEAAWLRFESGDLAGAVKLLESSGGNSPGLLALDAYRRQLEGDWLGSEQRLRELEKEYPLDDHLMRTISFVLHRSGQPEEALKYLEKAYALRPGDQSIEQEARLIRFEHVLELENRGQWDSAIETLGGLLREEQRSEYLFHLGYCRQQSGNLEEAVSAYRKGLDLAPDAVWARMSLALSYYSLGDFDLAAREWELLMAAERRPDYLFNLGLTRLRQERLEIGWQLIADAAGQGHEGAARMIRAAGRP